MAYAIFERATARMQPQSTRGNFWTLKPNIAPNIFPAEKHIFPISLQASHMQVLLLPINEIATPDGVAKAAKLKVF
jgi:hypothetical protein